MESFRYYCTRLFVGEVDFSGDELTASGSDSEIENSKTTESDSDTDPVLENYEPTPDNDKSGTFRMGRLLSQAVNEDSLVEEPRTKSDPNPHPIPVSETEDSVAEEGRTESEIEAVSENDRSTAEEFGTESEPEPVSEIDCSTGEEPEIESEPVSENEGSTAEEPGIESESEPDLISENEETTPEKATSTRTFSTGREGVDAREAENEYSILEGGTSEEGVLQIVVVPNSIDDLPLLASTPASSIYKVPSFLRKQSRASYTPRVISIGPYHHGKPRYAKMEKQKIRYAQRIIERAGVQLKSAITNFSSWEEKARGCYSERVEPDRKKLVKMLLIDAAFIIEFMLTVTLCDADDELSLMKPLQISHIQHDMKLLENQVPYFVLKDLWLLVQDSLSGKFETLEHLIATFFSCYKYNNGHLPSLLEDQPEPEHLVDLFRTFMVPPNISADENKSAESIEEIVPKSAVQLKKAGVFIRINEDPHMMNVTFRRGVLRIPRLVLDSASETLFRNIIAFEQCHPRCATHYISDYMILMDSLIRGSEELLLNKEIVLNKLSDGENALNLIHNLGKDVTFSGYHFYYAPLCKDLKHHCDRFIIKCMAWLMNYRRPITAFLVLLFFYSLGVLTGKKYTTYSRRP